jgi:hypothetical protein
VKWRCGGAGGAEEWPSSGVEEQVALLADLVARWPDLMSVHPSTMGGGGGEVRRGARHVRASGLGRPRTGRSGRLPSRPPPLPSADGAPSPRACTTHPQASGRAPSSGERAAPPRRWDPKLRGGKSGLRLRRVWKLPNHQVGAPFSPPQEKGPKGGK